MLGFFSTDFFAGADFFGAVTFFGAGFLTAAFFLATAFFFGLAAVLTAGADFSAGFGECAANATPSGSTALTIQSPPGTSAGPCVIVHPRR